MTTPEREEALANGVLVAVGDTRRVNACTAALKVMLRLNALDEGIAAMAEGGAREHLLGIARAIREDLYPVIDHIIDSEETP